MRTKLTAVISVLILALLLSSMADAQSLSLGLKASTLGGGIEVEGSFSDSLGARLGVNYFNYDSSGTVDDIDYEYDITLQSVALLLDWHPLQGSFRISGGALYNGNEFESEAKPSATYEIGNTTYTASDVGTLDGKIEFDEIAPYLGLGWDTSFGKNDKFGFVFDLGAIYQGTPDASLSASGPIASNPAFISDLEKEEENLQDDLDKYKFYPVVALGMSYRF